MIYEPRVLTMLFHWTITVAVSHLFIDIPVSIMTKLVAWFLMSSKTTNQTQPFKPRIFPTPALTELALCLPQLLHLAYDGKLQSGLFVLCVGFLFCFVFCFANSFHSSMFHQKLWESYNPSLPRGAADPWGSQVIPKGSEILRNSISLSDSQFPHVVRSFLELICRRIHLRFYLLSVLFRVALFPFYRGSSPYGVVSHRIIWRSICSLRHPKFPFPWDTHRDKILLMRK